MEETLKELAGDLAVIHESLERAEAVERQLGVYWREFEAERDQLKARLEAAERERDESRNENDFMRLRLAESDKACVYCALPKSEIGACAHGFPGCARADDLLRCDELTRRDEKQRREGAAEWLGGYLQGLSAGNPGAAGSMVAILEAELKRLREGGE